MAISVFPAAVTSSINANAITAVAAVTIYEGRSTFDPAIYTISCASGVITNFEFYNGAGTFVTSGVTSSGTVAINLASTADRIRLWTSTGTNTVVTITKTASALSNQMPSGTLDTITTLGSSTYTGTSTSGFAQAMLVGGGKGGNSGDAAGSGGAAGYAGQVTGSIVTLTGSMAVFVGSGGAGGAATAGFSYGTSNAGTNGTSTTFAGLTATGGGVNTSATPTSVYSFIVNGSTTPKGIGGTGGAPGTGGNGGGGGAGGAGGNGVLYILRF